mmetsp:Transcript_47847/g.126924  ORF Transcript_47847/g.126924 Transcript_47847/m.126924 type:complete len:103 (-) Transcript_47847:633-941(-)
MVAKLMDTSMEQIAPVARKKSTATDMKETAMAMAMKAMDMGILMSTCLMLESSMIGSRPLSKPGTSPNELSQLALADQLEAARQPWCWLFVAIFGTNIVWLL